MDILHKSILGYPSMNYGYPKIQPCLRISLIQFKDILKYDEYWIAINRLMYIFKSIYGYPKIELYFRLSIIQEKVIQKK